jgi:hypothetical protein
MDDEFPDVEALKGNKFGVKDSTVNEYRKKIAKMEKDGFSLERMRRDSGKFIDHLRTYAESTQKGYLSAVKWALYKDDIPLIIQDRIDELYKNQNKRDVEQKPTPKQDENLVPWSDISKQARDFSGTSDETLIAALYTLNPPVRADYGEMTVHVETTSGKGNELILKGRKTSVFLFRDYKTSATYGEVRIPVSPQLFDVLVADGVAERPTVLHKTRTPHALGILVNKVFSEITGKNVGIDILRHAYIIEHFPKMTTIKQKDELAKKMLHSRDRQEKYNLVG